MLSQGMTEQAILADYPYLESEDIRACLKYAAQIAQEGDSVTTQVRAS